MLLLTLRGSPTLYYGDELGIGAVEIPPDRIRDPWALREPGLGVGRDPERTPMQWDASAFAGFSTRRAVAAADARLAKAQCRGNGAPIRLSMLSLVRALLALAARIDHCRSEAGGGSKVRGDLLAYERSHEDDRKIIVLNFGGARSSGRSPSAAPQLDDFALDVLRSQGRGHCRRAQPSPRRGSRA